MLTEIMLVVVSFAVGWLLAEARRALATVPDQLRSGDPSSGYFNPLPPGAVKPPPPPAPPRKAGE